VTLAEDTAAMSDSRPEKGLFADKRLNERAQFLFKTLVERYIRDGQPVGSRTLSRDSGLSLSPATVRNVMADLEELGLLGSPHTSSGRVPTAQGYRLFVDTLLEVEPLGGAEVEALRGRLVREHDPQALTQHVSTLLSEITHLAGIVTVPRYDEVRVRHVEFLSLSGDQVLVILVVNDREVQNRIIRTGRSYSDSELQQASNYLNEICAGKALGGVRDALLSEMRQARERLNDLMVSAIAMAEQAFEPRPPDEDVVVAGQTHLMEYAELADMERLRHLFEAFSRKRDILHLLDNALHASGVQIFIGEESGYDIFDQCSVVTAPYESDGRVLGVLGVIGPTRMAYDRVIPIVDVTARLLGAALGSRS
jgi:heat-inducible transcriptional repressor